MYTCMRLTHEREAKKWDGMDLDEHRGVKGETRGEEKGTPISLFLIPHRPRGAGKGVLQATL